MKAMAAILMMTTMLPGASSAQSSLSAAGSQDLDFGAVIPGIPTVVQRSDRAAAGQFEIRGARRTEVQVEFTLPEALVSAAGHEMVVSFGPNDGGYSANNSLRNAQGFDPRVPLTATLGNSGRLYIFLGGTVSPVLQQRPGPYTARITLSVAYTGT